MWIYKPNDGVYSDLGLEGTSPGSIDVSLRNSWLKDDAVSESAIILSCQGLGFVWDTRPVIVEKNIRWACRYCEPAKRRKFELMLFMRRRDCCSRYPEQIQTCIPAAPVTSLALSDNEPYSTLVFMCDATIPARENNRDHQ